MGKLYKYHQKNLNYKTSVDIGEITPVFWTKLYPGEKIKNMKFANLTRMISPALPTLDNPYIELFTFAVPKRLLVQESERDYTTQGADITLELTEEIVKELYSDVSKKDELNEINKLFGISKFSFKNNYIYGDHLQTPEAHYALLENRNLLSRFGINKNLYGMVQSSKLVADSIIQNDQQTKTLGNTLNIMYLLAYWKIYESFFKNKQFEPFKYQGLISWIGHNYRKLTADNLNTIINNNADTRQKVISFLKLLNKIAVANVDNDYLNELTFDKINETNMVDALNWNTFNLMLGQNYSQNKMIINQLKEGTEKDLLLKIWNANNKDKTQAQLIGYYKYSQKISQVIQTSGSTSEKNELGETGGYSLTFNNGNLLNDFEANEETYILTLAVPNYKLVINNAFEQQEWLDWNLDDGDEPAKFINGEFMPNYENALQFEEPLFAYRDNPTSETNKNSVAGYTHGYSFLRHKKNCLGGQMQNYYSDWNYASTIRADESLNMSMLKVQMFPFKKTLVSAPRELDAFIMDFNFTFDIYRHIKPFYEVEDKILENE